MHEPADQTSYSFSGSRAPSYGGKVIGEIGYPV
jgi:hypothetical protein